ncbi:two-component system, OmpR family, response regulator PhoP [Nitrosomonas halophila]|uniref:Two-component system, OmpR family, response regulator PhoP n=2 Tax=Nitrosomonas halophila TaxID=44576 RepID=A0A1H3NUN5_9PROT|nr:two-component system, OmpR family, response regulator PhoP [Nitrosomonas halophila]
MTAMRILVIEDEAHLQQQICQQLESAGFMVDRSANGKEGLHIASEYPLDAAIVDLGLPGLSGLEIIATLRRQGSLLPILILTAQSSWEDKVKGLEIGADDYLAKPFQMEELLARIKALLRRAAGTPDAIIARGPISLNTETQTVSVQNQTINLTTFEYRLLELLMRNQGKIFSRQVMTDYLYPHGEEHDSNVLEVIIGRLRRKLDPSGTHNPIETVRGRGYRCTIEPKMQHD